MKLLILTQKIDKNDDVLGFMHGWIAEFARYCEKVTVIALEVHEYDLPRNVRIFSLGKENISQKSTQLNKKVKRVKKVYKVESKLKYLFNFYRYIWSERNNYDNVFVHMNPEYVVMGGLFWRLTRKKIGMWYMHKSVNLKLRIAEKLTNEVFSGTQESFRLKTKKLNITGHGIDIDKFKVSPVKFNSLTGQESQESKVADGFRIVTIGRISSIKDYGTLIDAMEVLQKSGLNIKLDILGDADSSDDKKYLESLIQKVKDKGLEEKINFVGSVPNKDIVNYLHQADIFVNTSQTGSLDKAILEAMACGLVVLSSNDSSRNIFGGYRDRLFFKPKDSEDLARKISRITKLSSGERIEIGKKLRETVVKDHNLEDLIKKIIRIYQKR